jgi:transcriptional regulator GlxA family with amidase domain
MRIGIFVFEGSEELDWGGPYEVLSHWASMYPDDGVEVITIGDRDGTVTCAKGLKVVPDVDWRTVPELDVLIYPGGRGNRAHLGNDDYRKWIHAHADSGTLMTSVCTGSLVYADAGLLDGRPATTHWAFTERLGSLGNDIKVVDDKRFVDDGDVITSQGVSAGIDMASWLVGQLHGREHARDVMRTIQYEPAPPYLADEAVRA